MMRCVGVVLALCVCACTARDLIRPLDPEVGSAAEEAWKAGKFKAAKALVVQWVHKDLIEAVHGADIHVEDGDVHIDATYPDIKLEDTCRLHLTATEVAARGVATGRTPWTLDTEFHAGLHPVGTTTAQGKLTVTSLLKGQAGIPLNRDCRPGATEEIAAVSETFGDVVLRMNLSMDTHAISRYGDSPAVIFSPTFTLDARVVTWNDHPLKEGLCRHYVLGVRALSYCAEVEKGVLGALKLAKGKFFPVNGEGVLRKLTEHLFGGPSEKDFRIVVPLDTPAAAHLFSIFSKIVRDEL